MASCVSTSKKARSHILYQMKTGKGGSSCPNQRGIRIAKAGGDEGMNNQFKMDGIDLNAMILIERNSALIYNKKCPYSFSSRLEQKIQRFLIVNLAQ